MDETDALLETSHSQWMQFVTLDNIQIERFWRTLKYEGIYLHQWKTVRELKQELPKLIYWYNNDRPHQSLRYKTPSETSCAFMDNLKSSYPQLHSHND